ncbi:unnamed protein product [Linum tenue]|uniref:ENTH domain-containing protein n=1 Tax=Linum tenue TaxID=586396 RepID=A0AAV0HUW9_9ROSI|nr:unnamed protein product [Linum tenue]
MSGGGSQNSLRKALGSIKDTTTVSLAKINSDYKELDIAIVKATNHVERPAKEKHIRAVFAAISATRPRADVAYCIHGLARRLSKTHNWAVALKTLVVIHRALREVDPTFHEELINYGRSRSHMLNMSHFKDDSSPNAWDYSAWLRTYALFLEERLESFRILKYDIETDRPRTKDLETAELLEQLPALQQLLFRVLNCQPQGAAVSNFIIRLALAMNLGFNIRCYNVPILTSTLLIQFFEMPRADAVKALEIYRKACQQAERLSEFYEICKSMDIGRGERFIKIEQPPASFLQTMEEYVRDAPRVSTVRKDQVQNLTFLDRSIWHMSVTHKALSPTFACQNLDDPATVASSELDERNSLALAIVPAGDQQPATAPTQANGTGWELALVTAPSSNETTAAASKLGGGLDKLTLDSLYDDAMRRNSQPTSYNPWEAAPMNGPVMQAAPHDPFFASNGVAASHNVQMAAMANQQQALMWQQQQQQMMMMTTPQFQQPANPFANAYGAPVHPYGSGMPPPVQSYQPYPGYL